MPLRQYIDRILQGTEDWLTIEEIQLSIVEEFYEWYQYSQIYSVLEGANTGTNYVRETTEKPYRYQLLIQDDLQAQ